MPSLEQGEVTNWVSENIHRFHDKRIAAIKELRLVFLIAHKNPYLFRAKGLITPESVVKALVDAFLSSHEEGIFGTFLEELAVFVAGRVKTGVKSGIKGVDLEFSQDGARYLLVIKSGPKWGNSGQLQEMIANFASCKEDSRD